MDLTRLVDQFSEIGFFIDTEQKSIYTVNYSRLQRISRYFFAAYLAVFLWFVVYISKFRIHMSQILALIIMFAFSKLLEKKREWFCTSFKRVRAVAMIYYITAESLLIMFDFSVNIYSAATFFMIGFSIVSLLYIDYPQIFVGLELSFFAAYNVIAVMVNRKPELMLQDQIIALVVAIVVLFSYWMVLETMTEDGRDERALKRKGDVDLLTGLLNKISFEREATAYLDSRTKEEEGALLIIDFDNFKTVNDKFGHLTGDAVLKKFGEILKNNFRQEDIIGRVGGDEFMVMMVGEITDDSIKSRCDNIQHDLYISKFGEAGGFSCSIGVAIDQAGFGFKDIYRVADDALYEAKARGKACFITWYTQRITVPQKKIVYIASPDPKLRNKIKLVLRDYYTYMESTTASKALNEISIYQEYLESIYFDYKMPDMEESVLRRYINSRPIFSKIPLHDIDTEL